MEESQLNVINQDSVTQCRTHVPQSETSLSYLCSPIFTRHWALGAIGHQQTLYLPTTTIMSVAQYWYLSYDICPLGINIHWYWHTYHISRKQQKVVKVPRSLKNLLCWLVLRQFYKYVVKNTLNNKEDHNICQISGLAPRTQKTRQLELISLTLSYLAPSDNIQSAHRSFYSVESTHKYLTNTNINSVY